MCFQFGSWDQTHIGSIYQLKCRQILTYVSVKFHYKKRFYGSVIWLLYVNIHLHTDTFPNLTSYVGNI